MTLVEDLRRIGRPESIWPTQPDRVSFGDPAYAHIQRRWPSAARNELAALPMMILAAPAGCPIELGSGPSIVLKGMVATYRSAGPRGRQMLAAHLPGDAVDALEMIRFDPQGCVMPLCPSRIALPRSEVDWSSSPALREAVWREGLREAAIYAAWLANVGRRPALPRMSHLFCELAARSEGADFADGSGFGCR